MSAVAPEHRNGVRPPDPELVRRIQAAVVGRLASFADRDRLAHADQRQLILAWIEEELESDARRRMAAGELPLGRDVEAVLIRAVESTVWGLGRLQALLDVTGVEDIHVTGSDVPLLRMSDGSIRTADGSVADTDGELIAQIQYIAAHHGSTERPFSPSQPFLNMELPDGSRLAAMRDVSARPVVTIRKHQLVDIALSDLVRMGTITAEIAEFLTALVHGKRSVVVTGMPAVGKTTLLRALARQIPRTERVATLETEFELNLHRLRSSSPLLVALETRGGSTEIDPATGRRAGELTLSDLLHQTLRMSVTRVIVGEVRGAEALPMLEAMNAGLPGSMCTLHAGSAADAFERVVTAALKGAGEGWSTGFVTRLAAQGIDYVVHMRQLDHPALGGRRRFVSEIAEVTDVAESGAVAMNRIFAPDGTGDPRPVFQVAPQIRWPFEEAGINLAFLGRNGSRSGDPAGERAGRGWR